VRKNDLKHERKKKSELLALSRKIIGRNFIDVSGITDSTFWKYVAAIRKANDIKPRNRSRQISDL